MTEAHSLEVARRRMLSILEEDPRRALAGFAAEDPLRIQARGALFADDHGLLFDPSDLMIDGYVLLVKSPDLIDDLPGWLERGFCDLVDGFGRELPSPALCGALGRALGLDDELVETWVDHFRALSLHDRRDLCALLRAGSKSFRAILPGRTFDMKRDLMAVHRAYSIFTALLARTVR